MTNNVSHRILALSMAFLLMFSSTGYTMDLHYCQDQLNDIRLFGKAICCSEMQQTMHCHSESEKQNECCQQEKEVLSQTKNDNCCHNESIVVESIDVDATSLLINVAQDIQLDFVSAFVAVYVFGFQVENKTQSFPFYKPPLADRDIRVLYQTFLI